MLIFVRVEIYGIELKFRELGCGGVCDGGGVDVVVIERYERESGRCGEVVNCVGVRL